MTIIPPDLIRYMQQCGHIAVLTGAGTSAESGVPTFRDAQTGLWAQYDPQELATPDAFARNPQLVWDWYAWRRELVAQSAPNAGHFALAAMAAHPANFTLITQNVDGLHQQAGSEGVIELHGNISRIKCARDGELVTAWGDEPRCPHCGSWLRPDVVWFGEDLPAAALEAAWQAAKTCDLFLTIGTSGVVQPAASLPLVAAENGAVMVELNVEDTPLSRFMDFKLRGASGEVLPGLVTAVFTSSSPIRNRRNHVM